MKIRHCPNLIVPAIGLILVLAASALASAPEPGAATAPSAEPARGRVLFQLTDEAYTSGDYRPGLGLSGRTGLADLDSQLGIFGIYQIAPAFNPEPNRAAKSAAGLDRIFFAYFDESTRPEQVAESLDPLAEVEYAEPDGWWFATFAPNDPLYPDQWAHDNYGQAIDYYGNPVGTPDCDTDTDLAWDLQTGDPNLILAIIDTGCDLNHPEYSSRIVQGYDFVNNDWDPSDDGNHGTACAGIALAAGNNNQGVAGVAWNVKLMPIKVLNGGGGGTWGDVADGIIFAADNGADILSLSLGGGSNNTVRNAVNYAHGLGCALFCATGNGDSNGIIYPARYDNAIAVGALSPCNERKNVNSCDEEYWWGSNYGTGIDFIAPGTRIHTTDRLGGAGYGSGDYISDFNGTSSATPHAAGIGALVWSQDPSLTNEELRTVLQNTCVDMYSSGYDLETGHGRLNAYDAVQSVTTVAEGACCYPDGSCQFVEEAQCPTGDWRIDVPCNPNPCPQPVGACCYPDGSCQFVEEAQCPTGDWRIDVPCNPNPCPQPVGACCYPDGSCQFVEEAQCPTGDWRIDVPCNPNPCPQPVGACCYPDGSCIESVEADCQTGDWRMFEPCNPNPCPQPVGACCYPDGSCQFVEEAQCPTGDWRIDVPCNPNPCPQPVGACCYPDGSCIESVEADCQTGDWRMFEPCNPNPCPQPLGACCYPDGSCIESLEADCPTGDWRMFEPCDPNPCDQPLGACCSPDGSCIEALEADCPTGDWRMFEPCDPNPCDQPPGACCYPDGSCIESLEADCPTGDWRMFEPCVPNPCDQPLGACCYPDGSCIESVEADCPTGDWRMFEPCDPNPCPQPVGACCYPDGSCQFVEEAQCPTGDWRIDVPCNPNPCPQPVGACCYPDGSCIESLAADCQTGDWRMFEPCDPNPCDQPLGACCYPDGSCIEALEADCPTGDWRMFEPCNPNPCPQPLGACCYPDGSCIESLEADCPTGDWRMFEPCNPNPCPQPLGACCYPDGSCIESLTADCPTGDWRMLEPCDPNPCPQPVGACCIDDICEILPEQECAAASGDWYPDIDSCDPNPCINTGAEDLLELPTELMLHRSTPNPFKGSTVLQYALPEETRLRLRVFDISGNVVRVLEDGVVKRPGYHQATWDGTNDAGEKVHSGVYFYSFETDSRRETQRVILMR